MPQWLRNNQFFPNTIGTFLFSLPISVLMPPKPQERPTRIGQSLTTAFDSPDNSLLCGTILCIVDFLTFYFVFIYSFLESGGGRERW